MLSGVLRSQTAVTVTIAIVRAFVELRRAATSYEAIERRLTDLERETTENSASTISSSVRSSRRLDS